MVELVAAHPTILPAASIERDLADPELLDRVNHRQSLTVQNLGLT